MKFKNTHIYLMMKYTAYIAQVVKSFQKLYDGIPLSTSASASSQSTMKFVVSVLREDWKYLVATCILALSRFRLVSSPLRGPTQLATGY